MYRIESDFAHRRLVMLLEGFWDPDLITRFAADLSTEASKIRSRCPDFSSLCDASQLQVQSANVIEGFNAIVDLGPKMTTGRSAIVVGSALLKLQAERVFKGTRARVFTDRHAAEDWLDEPTKP